MRPRSAFIFTHVRTRPISVTRTSVPGLPAASARLRSLVLPPNSRTGRNIAATRRNFPNLSGWHPSRHADRMPGDFTIVRYTKRQRSEHRGLTLEITGTARHRGPHRGSWRVRRPVGAARRDGVVLRRLRKRWSRLASNRPPRYRPPQPHGGDRTDATNRGLDRPPSDRRRGHRLWQRDQHPSHRPRILTYRSRRVSPRGPDLPEAMWPPERQVRHPRRGDGSKDRGGKRRRWQLGSARYRANRRDRRRGLRRGDRPRHCAIGRPAPTSCSSRLQRPKNRSPRSRRLSTRRSSSTCSPAGRHP